VVGFNCSLLLFADVVHVADPAVMLLWLLGCDCSLLLLGCAIGALWVTVPCCSLGDRSLLLLGFDSGALGVTVTVPCCVAACLTGSDPEVGDAEDGPGDVELRDILLAESASSAAAMSRAAASGPGALTKLAFECC